MNVAVLALKTRRQHMCWETGTVFAILLTKLNNKNLKEELKEIKLENKSLSDKLTKFRETKKQQEDNIKELEKDDIA